MKALTTRQTPPVNMSLKLHPSPQRIPHLVERKTSACRAPGAIIAFV
jgi:hypothetical protein